MEGSGPLSTSSGIVVHDQSVPRPNVLECQICLEPPRDPVATMCGHVFCWPCLYRWLQDGPKPCPVCRNILRRDIHILPLFGGQEEAGSKDGVADIPTRPNIRPFINGTSVISPEVNIPPVISRIARMEGVNDVGSLTASRLVDMFARDHGRLARQLLRERTMVTELTTERGQLLEEVNYSVREAQESRLREELSIEQSRQRELRHAEEIAQLGRHIVKLERRLKLERISRQLLP